MARTSRATQDLARQLNAGILPVYIVDERRRISYANDALGRWLGVDVGTLVGARCDYHAGDASEHPDRMAAGLCPPPDALAGRQTTAVIAGPIADERMLRRRATFYPLAPDEVESAGTLVIVDMVDLAQDESVGAAAEHVQLHEAVRAYRQAARHTYQVRRLVGQGAAIRQIRSQVELAARSGARVVIVGPPGSGREHVARTIHYGDARQETGPLVPLDCAVLDAELLQSSITAFVRHCADQPRSQPGRLLLLDVDRLARDAQAELARFLSLPRFELQTVATATLPLMLCVERAEFREDLGLALATLEIRLPPLRDRPEDIPALAQLLLEELNAAGRRQLGGFTPEALDQLSGYPWPGQVAELVSMIAEMHRTAEGPLLTHRDLPSRIGLAGDADRVGTAPDEQPIQLDLLLDEVERDVIERTLRQTKGNKAAAARQLGVSRPRLLRRIQQLKIGE